MKNSTINPEYWLHYGLQQDPFTPPQFSDDHGFCPDSWQKHIEFFLHICRYNNTLLSISAVSGMGKSLLLKQFSEKAETDMRLYQHTGEDLHSLPALAQAIAEGFDLTLNQDSGMTWQEQLNQLALALPVEPPHVFIVDNAEHLKDDVLLSLLDLVNLQNQDDVKPRLHFILCGMPALATRLEVLDKNPAGSICHHFSLPGLNLPETKAYIDYHFKKAGHTGIDMITDTMLDEIQSHSLGVPADINKIAPQVLTEHMPGNKPNKKTQKPAEKPEKPPKKKKKKLMWAIWLILIAAIALILIFQEQINALFEGKQATPAATATAPKKGLSEDQLQSKLAKMLSEPVKAPATLNKDKSAIPLETQTGPVAADKKATATKAPAPAEKQSNKEAPNKQTNANTKENTPKLDNLLQTQLTDTPTEINKAQTTTKPKEAVQTKAAPASKAKTVATINKPKAKKTTTPAKPKPKPVAKKPVPKAKPAKVYTQNEKDILAMKPSDYTMQLIGFRKLEQAQGFVKKHKITGQSWIVKSKFRNKPWYIVIYGRYQSRYSAITEKGSLPKSIGKIKPWIRSMGSIQKIIKSAK